MTIVILSNPSNVCVLIDYCCYYHYYYCSYPVFICVVVN